MTDKKGSKSSRSKVSSSRSRTGSNTKTNGRTDSKFVTTKNSKGRNKNNNNNADDDEDQYEFTAPLKGQVSVVPVSPENDPQHYEVRLEKDGTAKEKALIASDDADNNNNGDGDNDDNHSVDGENASVRSLRLGDLLLNPITPKTSAASRKEEDEMLAELITPNSKHSNFTESTEATLTPISRHNSYSNVSNTSSEKGSDSDEEGEAQLKDGSKKKKKKKKSKSKKSDKKNKKDKKEKRNSSSSSKGGSKKEKNEAPMTVSEENLVEELCGFLSDTLSTTHNKESFLRLLISGDGSSVAESTQLSVSHHATTEEYDAGYATLQSPASSVCESTTSHQSTLSKLYCMFPHDAASAVSESVAEGSAWSTLDPPSESHMDPSIASPISIKKAKLARLYPTTPKTSNKESLSAELMHGTPVSTESEQTKQSNSSDRTKKRSNCESDFPSPKLLESSNTINRSIPKPKDLGGGDNDSDEAPSSHQSSRGGLSTPSDQAVCFDRSINNATRGPYPAKSPTPQGPPPIVTESRPISENSSPEELFLALPPEFRSYLLGLHAEEMQAGQQQAAAAAAGRPDYTQPLSGGEALLMQPPVSEIPMCDEGTISSDITGFTGMTGSVAPTSSRPPIDFIGGSQRNYKPPVEFIGAGRTSSTSRPSTPPPHVQQRTPQQQRTPPPKIDMRAVLQRDEREESSESDEEEDDDEEDDDDDDDDDDESEGGLPDLASVAPSVYSHHVMVPNRSSIATGSIDSIDAAAAAPEVKKVCFDIVHVREYNTIIDSNPSCSQGPALSLGWKKIADNIYYIDEYDNKHRRANDELILSTETREIILSKLGYTRADIASSVRKIIKVRNQRRRTSQTVRVQNLEFAMERVGRRFKHLLQTGGNGGSKRKVEV